MIQLNDISKKYDDAKTDLKIVTTELEKLKAEIFVTSKKLQTIEMEHGAEVKCYQDEIEELQEKLRVAEKKLDDSENNS